MKLTGLSIDGFGVWKDLRLTDLTGGVTALYGPNEAGKTTLMHFVRTVLYGFSPERRQRFLPPVRGGRPGGWLQVELPAGSARLERYADTDDSLGQFVATGEHGQLPTSATLRTALSDIDEATFNNVYAVGLREMQELGTLSDTDAARWLYSLTTGLDRVSLLDVVRDLDSSRERLLSREGRPSEITELLETRSRLQDEIDQLVAQGRRWSQINVKLDELAHEVKHFEAQRGVLEFRARSIEIAVNVKPKWLERIDLDRQLKAFDGRIRLPDDALGQLDGLKDEIEEHHRQREVLRRQRHDLRDQAEALGINEMLVRNASRIEALGEQQDWLEALERQQSALSEELSAIQSQLSSENEKLGFNLQSVQIDKTKVPEISEGLVATLRPHARAVRERRERLAAAKKEAETKRSAESEYRVQLEAAMPAAHGESLPTDIEEAGELVGNLRKRLHAEQRLEQARRQEIELQQQNHELLDRQEAPLWTAALLAGLLVFGIAALAFGLLAPSFAAKVLGGVSLACFFGWHFFKYIDEDQITGRREACHRQMDLVRKQLDGAETERREVDRSLGPVEGSVVVRLQAAERHLAELEKLLPVETRRREARLESDAATRRMAEAERQLEAALTSWQDKLKGLGLPKDLTPSDIRAIAGRYEQVADLRLRVERRRGDAQQRRREHTALCKRIRALAEEVHLVLTDASPVTQLEHLQSELRQHGMRVEARDRLRGKARELKENETRHARAASALRHRRESIFVHAGAEDEAAYRQFFSEQQQADKLRTEREALNREIAAAIGTHALEPEIAELLAPESIGMLDRWWEETTTELEGADEQLKEVVARRGALGQELSLLAEDRSLTIKQLDLAEVEEQLRRAISKWRAHATVGMVLDEVRTRYEKERQPETLIEASAYMQRLTAGAYRRIWTPLGKEILFVDNAKGESLPVEVLSRGTREQLFLSLRLALVALLARQGVRLPMVLDDVLVNFDEGRALQAVRVLGDFAAAGHQILVFTCHEHVWQMFREMEFDTRQLSEVSGAVAVRKSRQKPRPAKRKKKLPAVAAVASAPQIVSEPPDIVWESPVEYLFEGEEEFVPPPPPPRPQTKPVPHPEPVYLVPPPVVDAFPIADGPSLQPSILDDGWSHDDEWVRIGPQVRRRERAARRTDIEQDADSDHVLEYEEPFIEESTDPRRGPAAVPFVIEEVVEVTDEEQPTDALEASGEDELADVYLDAEVYAADDDYEDDADEDEEVPVADSYVAADGDDEEYEYEYEYEYEEAEADDGDELDDEDALLEETDEDEDEYEDDAELEDEDDAGEYDEGEYEDEDEDAEYEEDDYEEDDGEDDEYEYDEEYDGEYDEEETDEELDGEGDESAAA